MMTLHLRFYEELNDFLPQEKRKVCFDHAVLSPSSIKDVIESIGVPHTEIDLILVNGKSVDFHYQVQHDDYISVYPVFESFDIHNMIRLHAHPLRDPRFILDVHLGKLASYLRLLGFDVVYDNHYTDKTIVLRGQNEKRIILTRDIGLLKNKSITHGYWIRHTDPEKQVVEVLKRFDLSSKCSPFTRCMECNGLLETVEKDNITAMLPPLTKKYNEHFMQCHQCKKIYWEGTHYNKLKKWVDHVLSSLI
jgi:uncharacterized protein